VVAAASAEAAFKLASSQFHTAAFRLSLRAITSRQPAATTGDELHGLPNARAKGGFMNETTGKRLPDFNGIVAIPVDPDADPAGRPPDAPMSPAIRDVVAFIETNFAQPLGLTQMAALCGLSLHRFVTVFRCQVGIPPHQYLCRTRVRHARRLLRQGLPLASVAIDSGFCDQSHLSRHFKRQCGITPGHFAGTRHRHAMPDSLVQ
jgi:AraC-like DNA-binding protein